MLERFDLQLADSTRLSVPAELFALLLMGTKKVSRVGQTRDKSAGKMADRVQASDCRAEDAGSLAA